MALAGLGPVIIINPSYKFPRVDLITSDNIQLQLFSIDDTRIAIEGHSS